MGKIEDEIGKIYWFRDSNGYQFKGKNIGNGIYQTTDESINRIFTIGNDVKKTGDATSKIKHQLGVDYAKNGEPIVIGLNVDEHGTVRINDHNSHMADALSHAMPLEMKSKEELIKEIRKMYDSMRIMQVNNKTVEKENKSVNEENEKLRIERSNTQKQLNYEIKAKAKVKKRFKVLVKSERFWRERAPPLEPKCKTVSGTYNEILTKIIDEHAKYLHFDNTDKLLNSDPSNYGESILRSIQSGYKFGEKRLKEFVIKFINSGRNLIRIAKNTKPVFIVYDRDQHVAHLSCSCGVESVIGNVSFDYPFTLMCNICQKTTFSYIVKDKDKYSSLYRTNRDLTYDGNSLREKILKLEEVNGDKIIELEKSLHIANQYSEAMVLLVDQHCAEKNELKKQLANK